MKTLSTALCKVSFICTMLLLYSGISQAQYPTTSVLADGDLYQLQVSETGIYKLDYTYLKDELGIDIDKVNPQHIQILHNGGGVLPAVAGAYEYLDLPECAIQVVGGQDGRFDPSDYILFYGGGANTWIHSPGEGADFSYKVHPYSEHAFAYLKIGNTPGKRVESKQDVSGQVGNSYTTQSYDAYQYYGEENINLLYENSSTEGSGQRWYSESYRITRQKNYDFEFAHRIISEPVHANMGFAARSPNSSRAYLDMGGQSAHRQIPSVNLSRATNVYAKNRTVHISSVTGDVPVQLTVRYPEGNSASEGWLDYLEVQARCSLLLDREMLAFRDLQSIESDFAQYRISNAAGEVTVWDVTHPLDPYLQQARSLAGIMQFTAATEGVLREYIVFNKNAALNRPTAAKRIPNQNLHGITDLDMLIIYHPDFESEVDRFMQHRSQHSGLRIHKVPVEQVFHEFSSGMQDPSAIRDFARMLHERGEGLQSVLLFGDASFDFKNNLNLNENQRHHFVTTYETVESLSPLSAFPSDTYFALLEDGEGGTALTGTLDIGIGRFPVKTLAEARQVVTKIIRYDTEPTFLKPWRNRAVFIGDDEDGNTHFNDSEIIAKKAAQKRSALNIEKVYFDAYQEVSTSGGDRYPKVQELINRNMFRGALIMNYFGHGGPNGWAQERVLTTEDISSWNNTDQYPLMITATCSFTGYDEPNFVSAGEQCFLNPNGGAIALYTTVRPVYASQNEALVNNTFNTLLSRVNGEYLNLGENMRRASNVTSTNETNNRKFSLIGDPSMKLALPQGQVMLTNLNGVSVDDSHLDTLQALSKGTFTGFVADENGNQISDFNGEVYMSIFDKPRTLTTLGQAHDSYARDFQLRNNVLFKGVAKVTNGTFSIDYVIPKDIDYAYGKGRISLYAEDGAYDAAGNFDSITVGGTNPDALLDEQGPTVEVYMNGEQFAVGGITDANPVLFVKLSDDNGINISNAGLGHEITAVLDGNESEVLVLNDFYESDAEQVNNGSIRFPLYDLDEGRHEVRVKAWDVSNNAAEGYTEFIVAGNDEMALQRVINYPNPFTTRTCFEFEHNHPGQTLSVHIRIYTIGGTLVKTLHNTFVSNGNRVSCADGLVWNGLDDYGDQLARGVYVYRVSVRTQDAAGNTKTVDSDFEKLVILK